MNTVSIIFGVLISITIIFLFLLLLISPRLVDEETPLGRWWRRNIVDWEPESREKQKGEEGEEK